jgi:CubicO group peptidase (beta-lactamase class C family)
VTGLRAQSSRRANVEHLTLDGHAMLASMRPSMVIVGVALCTSWACGSGQHAVTRPPPGAKTPPPATAPAAAATPPAGARVLERDETVTSPSGATFTVVTGWSLASQAGQAAVTLTEPQGELTMTYLEVQADSGEQAIALGWRQVRPDFALAVASKEDVPARDGWDALTQIMYVTPTAEARLVVAVALGKGKTWRLFLIDGKQAALSRRGSELGITLESLKAPDVKAESWAGKPARVLDRQQLAELDAFVEHAMQVGKVPGAAVAIVQGGKVVHERGFGVRELGKPAKVGPHTLFLTGSTGKSLVTLMMARAVDAGAFAWDTPVTQLLPSFALGDAEVTRAMRVHHTVCACTGMPRQDLEMLFEYRGVTPEMRLAAMKTMTPSTGFGETFQYSNLLVMAGGYAAGHALYPRLSLGAAFDKAMQAQVFDPLGMKRSTYDFKRATRGDHARPHAADLDGTMRAIPLGDEAWVTTVRPAGGQWSSVHDYARVLLLELGKGELEGKRVVSEANLMERRKPQVKVSDTQWYGMGLLVGTTNGVAIVQHNGGTAGFSTDYFWLPEHGVGVVIVSNAGGSGTFVSAVKRRILEALFDGEARADADLLAEIALQERRRSEELTLMKAEVDASWFAPLAGAWVSPGLGRIELSMQQGKVLFDAGEWRVAAAQKMAKDGTQAIATTGAPFGGVELVPEDRGGKRVLVLRDGQREYVFEKVQR